MKNIIQNFIQDKKVALVGVSRDPKKWGNMLFRELRKNGFTVYPVNRNAELIKGEKCYPTVSELPKDVKNAIITLPSDITEQIVKECAQAGIKRIWMHKGAGGKGSQSKTAIEYCKANGIDVVYGLCPLMFFTPTSIHKVHFWLRKVLHRLPEEFSSD